MTRTTTRFQSSLPSILLLAAACLAAPVPAGCGGCPATEALCGEICVDTTRDATNCGACGTACAQGSACIAGKCVVTCPAGQIDCGGTCHTFATDRLHCGACDKACANGELCANGACVTSCAVGQSACNGGCHDLQSDATHCGGCGMACKSGEVCVKGACAVSCPMGQANCAGACRDTQSDGAHCGGCGMACAPGSVCSLGRCVASCGAPLTTCGNGCIDPRFDPSNCGACGMSCTVLPNSTAQCDAGRCILGACSGGFGNCNAVDKDGCETDLRIDLKNCGRCGGDCGTPANGTASCAASTCKVACNANFGDCNGNFGDGCELDLRIDRNNCGGCGKVCPQNTPGCVGGVCTATLASCQAYIDARASQGDGIYTIDPDGAGPIAPYKVYCDMTTDGGGWEVMAWLRKPAHWDWALFTDNGVLGDTVNGFSSGLSLQKANDPVNEKIVIYKNIIESGKSLGQQWMAVRRTDGVAVQFSTLDSSDMGWKFRDSFGTTDPDTFGVCSHGCATYRGFGMFHNSGGIGFHGTQGGDLGCRDGNNICWSSRGLGCNAGAARCAYLTGANEGVVYGVRKK